MGGEGGEREEGEEGEEGANLNLFSLARISQSPDTFRRQTDRRAKNPHLSGDTFRGSIEALSVSPENR